MGLNYEIDAQDKLVLLRGDEWMAQTMPAETASLINQDLIKLAKEVRGNGRYIMVDASCYPHIFQVPVVNKLMKKRLEIF